MQAFTMWLIPGVLASWWGYAWNVRSDNWTLKNLSTGIEASATGESLNSGDPAVHPAVRHHIDISSYYGFCWRNLSNPVLAAFPIVGRRRCKWYAWTQVAAEILLTPGAVISEWLVFPWRASVARVRIHQRQEVSKIPGIYRIIYAKEGQKEPIFLSAQDWRPSKYYEQCNSSFVPPIPAAVTVTTQYAAGANRSPPSSIIVVRPACNRGSGGSLPSPVFGFT